MMNLGSPFSKEEIVDSLKHEMTAVRDYFVNMPDAEFFEAPTNIWSPAENLVHLIKSVSPLVNALKLPKMALKMRFGKAKHASRPLAGVRKAYMQFVDAGTAIAPSNFAPDVSDHSAAERVRILHGWERKCGQLVSAVESWEDDDLDHLVVPHPLLGDMTLREILLFTLYHNQHHVNDVQRLRNELESEWFEIC